MDKADETDLSLATAEVLSGGQLERTTQMDLMAASGRPIANAAQAPRYASPAVGDGRMEEEEEERRVEAWSYSKANLGH
ncbi:hypothetical protein HPP92_004233 [Vanilla planifolia]|uniref:Uncharacterized protein n=1 Tax=Vanilla planifolia TaxID=51239 RepID=A0A835S8N8_VANPL|nr:hypothetical protein HPP92_004233 [Vanilla planifolia]